MSGTRGGLIPDPRAACKRKSPALHRYLPCAGGAGRCERPRQPGVRAQVRRRQPDKVSLPLPSETRARSGG
ncbi:hypothetical protein [Azospirillum endophyticum]